MNKSAIVILGMMSMAGCGGGKYLRWSGAPPASAMSTKVALEVTDKREEKKGGLHAEQIGLQTGSFGIPQAIKLKNETLAGDVRDLLTQAAASSGLGVVAAGQEAGAAGKFVVEVQTFWCTGYNPVYKADITASVTVVDPATGAVRVPAQPLTASGGGMVCQSIYKKLLSDIYRQAASLLPATLKQASASAPAGGAPAGQ